MSNIPNPAPRPPKAMAYMAAPLVFAALLMLAGGGVAVLGFIGGTASGDRVDMRFDTTCAAQAQPIIAARMDAVGLGQPLTRIEPGAIVATATLPGLEDDRTAMPALLSRPGSFEVRAEDGHALAQNADLISVELRLDESGMPFTWLEFKPDSAKAMRAHIEATPDGSVDLVLDGVVMANRPNSNGLADDTLRLISGEGSTAARMRRSTDHAILLQHGPFPCPITVGLVADAPTP